MVVQRLIRIGMPLASAGTPSTSLSALLMTTRAFGNSALRSPLAMLRKHFSSTEPAGILRRSSWRSSRFEAISAFERMAANQRHVVIDVDFDLAAAPAEPFHALQYFLVVSAPVETHL